MEEEIIEKRKQGELIEPILREKILKDLENLLFTQGYKWEKMAYCKRWGITYNTLVKLIQELNDSARYKDYEAMQINRLEKHRQLLLEEFNALRDKSRPRSHILKEIRETEKQISDERRKAGIGENKEIINLNSTGQTEFIIKVIDGQDGNKKED